ncbi:CDP-alcohol phosphatidyltransferase family protein [Sinorhizobium sp. 8-89]|uniref:CDP-alcohol phosphatidyltransferase family protein n=1 Tax=Sinorhizobium sp. 7-81 TaxID=3049087 RepID=UPI0024C4649A|nr:CDP-alcohol phosphatidyltransferase family protein [Sinorhizobium sp. 7-81]MDK1389508.1 CDP-alcohol phosphatidyltransferase family protein [Sinorhizobium sp. 7-81]
MLRVLSDPANVLTLVGLLLSAATLPLFLAHQYAFGLSLLNLALFIDHVDGIVARRTPNRRAECADFGKQFDSYTDILGACIAPAVLLLVTAPDWRWGAPLTVITIVTGAIRLSYFNAISFQYDHVVGFPITYTVPICSALFMFCSLTGFADFGSVWALSLATILILQLSSFPFPKLQGAGYRVVLPLNIVFAALLLILGAHPPALSP